MQDNLVQRRPLICNNAENLKTVRNSIFPFLLFLLLGVNGSNQRLFEGFSIILIILHFEPIFFSSHVLLWFIFLIGHTRE